jgi:septal ring factor EnvC (AmiA/AmiB activator)
VSWPTEAEIDRRFSLQKPTAGERVKLDRLRAEAKSYARSILELTPQNADQSAAIRLLHQAMQTAIASVVCATSEAREKLAARQYRAAEQAELARGPAAYRVTPLGGP